MKNPWRDWRLIYSIVGPRPFHIYNILPDGTPNPEIRKLTASLQSLVLDGTIRKLRPIELPKYNNGNRKVNMYVFCTNRKY